jgi:hypothetical protein
VDLPTAAFGSQAIVALVAGAASIRRPDYRSAAALFGTGMVVDVARRGLWTRVLEPPMRSWIVRGERPPPLTGWLRVFGHIDQALFFLAPAGIAALAFYVLVRRTRLAVTVGATLWSLTVGAFVVLYPWLRFERAAAAHKIVHVACLACAAGAIAWWLVHSVPSRVRAEKGPRAVEVVTVLAVAIDALVAFGAYADRLIDGWSIAQSMYVVLNVCAALILAGGWLWNLGSGSRETSPS